MKTKRVPCDSSIFYSLVFTNRGTLKLNFEGEEIEVPADILKLDDLSAVSMHIPSGEFLDFESPKL
jgi:hypothetical protein